MYSEKIVCKTFLGNDYNSAPLYAIVKLSLFPRQIYIFSIFYYR